MAHAGISNENKRIGELDFADFQAMLQSNVFGLYPIVRRELQSNVSPRTPKHH